MLLSNLQAELAEALLSEQVVADKWLPVEHIQIYQHNINSTLTRALKDTYPLVNKLVGDDYFNQVAQDYILNYPSRSGNLHDYGRYFPNFLPNYDALHQFPYLTDVAALEWACHSIYFAADHAPLNITRLAQITPEQLNHVHFILHPASQLLIFQHPILDIIDFCKNNHGQTLTLTNTGANLLIIRRELEIALVPLSKADFTFLYALSQHASGSEALKLTLQQDPHFKLDEKLPMWVQDKTIVDCNITE
jgi:hypothetical protein